MCSDKLSTQYNQDFSKLVGKYALSGNPDQCIARLKEYVESGARTVILSSACPPEYMEENQQLLAKTVLPEFTS
jgi:alkanesulfonate monooxygenase SsuD/methylene tetrahydromethanopterin reductase-like flavin-dependent oxidoreductase (luciferase family)